MNDELARKIEAIKILGQREPVRIILNEDKHSAGEVYIKRWTDSQRKWRALKLLLQMWALGLVSVLIPIAHFFLVPIFFLAGLAGYPILLRQNSTILGGQGTCPNCGKNFEIVRCAEKWPLEDICNHCSRHVRILAGDA